MASNGNGKGRDGKGRYLKGHQLNGDQLSPKQECFVEEFLKCWNKSEAYRRAGYKPNRHNAARLSTNEHIQARIKQRLAEKAMEADECIGRLADQARGSIAEFVEITGKASWIVNLEKGAERGKLHLIQRLRPGPGGEGVDVQLYNAQTALVKIGEHLGLFREAQKSEVDVLLRWWDDVEAARAGPSEPGEGV